MIGSTHVGHKHQRNEDAILLRQFEDNRTAGMIAVADGVTKSPSGEFVARWLVEQLDQEPTDTFLGTDTTTSFFRCLNRISDRFREAFERDRAIFESGASLSVVIADGQAQYGFWVGDTPIYATSYSASQRSLVTERVSHPDVRPNQRTLTDWFGGTSPFRVKCVVFPHDCRIATITSDGATYRAKDLNRLYQHFGFSIEVVDHVIKKALSQPRSDDVSLVAMRLA